MKEKIASDKFRSISSERADELSIADVEKLANELLLEKKAGKQEMYLRFFAERKFPLDYHAILDIAKRKNPGNTRLVEFAVFALRFFSGRDIRNLAIEKLKTEKNPHKYLRLLVSNYKKGDNNLLIEIAGRSVNYDIIHSIGFGFVDIYEANNTKECKGPLELLYKKMNCGICRKSIISILIDNNVLADTIREEIRFDCNREVRKLYKRTLKMGGQQMIGIL